MLFGIVIALMAGFVFLDYIPCLKKRKMKENIFYGAVLTFSFGIIMLTISGVTLPSPTEAIQAIVEMIVPIE